MSIIISFNFQYRAKRLFWPMGLGLLCSASLLSACAPSVVLPTLRPTLTHTPLPTHTVVIPTAALPVATATLRAYPPPPHGTASPFDATATRTTPDATIMALVTDFFATRNAVLTPPTPVAILADGWLYNPAGHFKIHIPPSWHSSDGGATISNYDLSQDLSPGDLRMHLGVGTLALGQSIEQWQADWKAYQLSPENGSPQVTFTDPAPIRVSTYSGLSYFIIPPEDLVFSVSVLEIVLKVEENRFIVISIVPADSSALPEAMSILDTMDILSPDEQP